MKFLLILSSCVGLLGCASDTGEDTSMYLTGTEELAVQTVDGAYVCEAPKKVLLCHIPPGNPANAHTICVGAAAVAAHQAQHGDLLGACEGNVEPPPGDDVPGDDPGDDAPPPGEDPPPSDLPDID